LVHRFACSVKCFDTTNLWIKRKNRNIKPYKGVCGGSFLAKITISDDLHQKIKKAVEKGACCSVDHYVERTLNKSL
jgi:hypothetical protein